jgi:hypothetical protein
MHLQEGHGSFPPWLSKMVCGGGRGRGDDGGEGWLKGTQGERGQNANSVWGGTRNLGPHTYTPMEDQRVDPAKR